MKTIIINLVDIKIKGDVLDVGESYGVIYNLYKDIEEEISVDYVDEKGLVNLKQACYDTCTMFFSLSGIWRDIRKLQLIKDASSLIKKGGSIYIWDINKEVGEVFNNVIRAILPSGTIKEFEFKNVNPLLKSNIEQTKKMLSEDFSITEEKLWEDIYFIKGEKIK